MSQTNLLKLSTAIAAASLLATSGAMAASIATTTAEVTIVYDGTFPINGTNGDASQDITVTGWNNIDFIDETVDSFETPTTGFATVNALADTPVPTVLNPSDSISFSFTANSEADFRDTTANALAALSAFIEVSNSSLVNEYLIQFSAIYSLETTVSEDKPALQTAFSDLEFVLATDIGGTAIDISLEADTETGILTQSSASDQVLGNAFGFNVLGGEDYLVTASLSGSAFASSVPVPASLLFMSFGLLLLRSKTR